MSDIEELIRHKFEAKTGCKPRISFKTNDDVILAPEVTLEEVPRGRNTLKLFGIIIKNDLPPIADRYNKICETLGMSKYYLLSIHKIAVCYELRYREHYYLTFLHLTR